MTIGSKNKDSEVIISESDVRLAELRNLTASSVRISGSKVIEKLVIHNVTCDTLHISIPVKSLIISRESNSISSIKRLDIELHEISDKPETTIQTNGLGIDKLNLTGNLNGGRILIKESDFKDITLSSFINKGDFGLYSVKINDALRLLNVSLSNAEWNDVILLGSVHISKSNISDIRYQNTKFPLSIIAEDERDYSGTRDIYRQLEGAAIRQKDRKDELLFQQKKYELLEKQFSLEKSWQSVGDKFILCTNRLSNKHGQDWLRAFTITLALAILFYTTIKYQTGHRYFSWSNTPGELSSFLSFLANPLHKANEVFGVEQLVGYPLLLDTVFKLLSGFLLFQMIRAFRKFVG